MERWESAADQGRTLHHQELCACMDPSMKGALSDRLHVCWTQLSKGETHSSQEERPLQGEVSRWSVQGARASAVHTFALAGWLQDDAGQEWLVLFGVSIVIRYMLCIAHVLPTLKGMF